jgi:hypothetical protein
MRYLLILAFIAWPFCAPVPKSATVTLQFNGQKRTLTISPIAAGAVYSFDCTNEPCKVVRQK